MSVEAIKDFLGIEPMMDGVVNPDSLFPFFLQSKTLGYELSVDIGEKVFSVSAHPELPFGYNSLFEIHVEFDRLQIELEPEFYGDQKILVCRKDYPEEENFKTLMIMKWDDGELSIWPSYVRLEARGKNN